MSIPGSLSLGAHYLPKFATFCSNSQYSVVKLLNARRSILQETILVADTQNGITSELIDVIRLLIILAVRKIKLQHIFYFTAFLAFGIGDGITGALMMNSRGIGIEVNPIVRNLFMVQGVEGVMTGKMWLTFMILAATYIVQLNSPNMYWTVNGFLIALTAGGLMAVNANLTAMAGQIPAEPGALILAYLILMFILTEIGSLIDGHARVH
jgi:hypothetical protein